MSSVFIFGSQNSMTMTIKEKDLFNVTDVTKQEIKQGYK